MNRTIFIASSSKSTARAIASCQQPWSNPTFCTSWRPQHPRVSGDNKNWPSFISRRQFHLGYSSIILAPVELCQYLGTSAYLAVPIAASIPHLLRYLVERRASNARKSAQLKVMPVKTAYDALVESRKRQVLAERTTQAEKEKKFRHIKEAYTAYSLNLLEKHGISYKSWYRTQSWSGVFHTLWIGGNLGRLGPSSPISLAASQETISWIAYVPDQLLFMNDWTHAVATLALSFAMLRCLTLSRYWHIPILHLEKLFPLYPKYLQKSTWKFDEVGKSMTPLGVYLLSPRLWRWKMLWYTSTRDEFSSDSTITLGLLCLCNSLSITLCWWLVSGLCPLQIMYLLGSCAASITRISFLNRLDEKSPKMKEEDDRRPQFPSW